MYLRRSIAHARELLAILLCLGIELGNLLLNHANTTVHLRNSESRHGQAAKAHAQGSITLDIMSFIDGVGSSFFFPNRRFIAAGTSNVK